MGKPQHGGKMYKSVGLRVQPETYDLLLRLQDQLTLRIGFRPPLNAVCERLLYRGAMQSLNQEDIRVLSGGLVLDSLLS